MVAFFGRRFSKYGNQKVVIDGITFHSIKEGLRYKELKLLKKARMIRELVLQPEFILIPDFVDAKGNKVRGIKYRADFGYYEYETDSKTDKRVKKKVVEDVKGFRTKEYELKRKMFLYFFKEVDFREV